MSVEKKGMDTIIGQNPKEFINPMKNEIRVATTDPANNSRNYDRSRVSYDCLHIPLALNITYHSEKGKNVVEGEVLKELFVENLKIRKNHFQPTTKVTDKQSNTLAPKYSEV